MTVINRGENRDDVFRMQTRMFFQPCETERSGNRLEYPMLQPMQID